MHHTLDSGSIRRFYDAVYEKGDIRDNARLYRRIIALLDPRPGTVLLDVGCGVGCLLQEAFAAGVHPYGLDLSHAALVKARGLVPAACLSVGDGEHLPFREGAFDYVVSLGSIEHFIHPEAGIREIARLLKPLGRAALILPNRFYLGDILRVARGRDPEAQWQIQETLLTRAEWCALLESGGLRVERVYGYNKYPELFKPGTLKMKSLRKFVQVSCMKICCPLNLSWQFVFVCRRK